MPCSRPPTSPKSYGGIHALRGATIDVRAGEVHALLGENGTGKSTLMRILCGVEPPDSGQIALHGEPVQFRSAAQAREAGVGIVFQELSLFPDLDVLANLFVGRELTRHGLVDRKAMRAAAKPIVDRLGLSFPLETKVATLTLAERQLVEIAKALVGRARLLILDEPNSALNAGESARLFKLINDLRDGGTALIYISHRLEEVFSLADRISVMRGGRIVETDKTSNLTLTSVVTSMLGRTPTDVTTDPTARVVDAPVAVRLDQVGVRGRVHDVSLDVHEGEVVGLVGLEGAGQQDVLRAIFGDLAIDAGRMELAARRWSPKNPRDAARAGVAFVPADRTRAGLMMNRSIGDNIAPVRMAIRAEPIYWQHDLHRRAERRVAELKIRTASTHQSADSLSGGNQQKIVLAKWLEIKPRVLLLDDPTRGVDVGGKAEIYELITRLADTGVAVLFTSSEFGEYQSVCHRVVVFRSGRAVGEMDVADASEHVLAEAVNSASNKVHRQNHSTSAYVTSDHADTNRNQGAIPEIAQCEPRCSSATLATACSSKSKSPAPAPAAAAAVAQHRAAAVARPRRQHRMPSRASMRRGRPSSSTHSSAPRSGRTRLLGQSRLRRRPVHRSTGSGPPTLTRRQPSRHCKTRQRPARTAPSWPPSQATCSGPDRPDRAAGRHDQPELARLQGGDTLRGEQVRARRRNGQGVRQGVAP